MSDYSYTTEGGDESPVPLADFPGVAAQLDDELVGWLTTVSPSGQPQSSAVWFVREGDTLLVYSTDKGRRPANLEANPRVAFNLRSDPQGDRVVTLEGVAVTDEAAPPPADNAGYVAKYGTEIERLGWTPESFGTDFPIPIRITPNRLRAWEPS